MKDDVDVRRRHRGPGRSIHHEVVFQVGLETMQELQLRGSFEPWEPMSYSTMSAPDVEPVVRPLRQGFCVYCHRWHSVLLGLAATPPHVGMPELVPVVLPGSWD